jgi:cyclopropane-fatty-acyl-phospholipid synthase
MAKRNEVLALGFDTRFLHIWEFYLAYCEAAFLEDNIDVVQYTLRKAPLAL